MLILSWKDKQTGAVDMVRFDVVTTETHESLLAITDHPVEEGNDVVDNARPSAPRVTVVGYVSNKPLWSNPDVEKFADFREIDLVIPKQPKPFPLTPGGLTRLATGAISDVLTEIGLKAGPPSKYSALAAQSGFPNRAKIVYETLLLAQSRRSRVKIVTTMREVDNMLIERLNMPRTVEDGNGATFEIDLKNIRTVQSATTNAPVPLEARGAGQTSKGSQNPKAKDDAKKKAQLESWLVNGWNAAGGIGGLLTGVPGAPKVPF